MKGMAHEIKCSEKVLCVSYLKIYQLFSLNDHIQVGEFSNHVDLVKKQATNTPIINDFGAFFWCWGCFFSTFGATF